MSQKDITRRDFVRKTVVTTTVGSVGAASLLSANPANEATTPQPKLSEEERRDIMVEKLRQTLQETTFDRHNLEAVIGALACLSETGRRVGLLALEPSLVAQIPDPILMTLVQYAIDGMDVETVMDIASDMTRAQMFQYESYCHIITWGAKMLVQCRSMRETQNCLLPILGLGVKTPRGESDLQAILERAWARKDRDALLDTFLEAVQGILQGTDFSPSQPRAAIEAIACLSEAARIYGVPSLNRETLFSAIDDPILRAVLREVAAGASEADVCAMATKLTQADLSKQKLYLTVIAHGCKFVKESTPGDEVRQRLHGIVDYLSRA